MPRILHRALCALFVGLTGVAATAQTTLPTETMPRDELHRLERVAAELDERLPADAGRLGPTHPQMRLLRAQRDHVRAKLPATRPSEPAPAEPHD